MTASPTQTIRFDAPFQNPVSVVCVSNELAFASLAEGGIARLAFADGRWSVTNIMRIHHNEGSDSETFKVFGLALSPDASLLAAGCFISGSFTSVVFIDVAAFRKVGSVPQADGAQTLEVTFSADGQYVFASNESAATISVIAVNGGTAPALVQAFSVDSTPTAVVVDGTSLLVTSEGATGQPMNTGSLQIFDVSDPGSTSPPERIGYALISPSPVRVAISTTGGAQYAWVSARGPNSGYDGHTIYGFSVEALLGGEDTPASTTQVDKQPVGLQVFEDNTRLAVADSYRFVNPLVNGKLTVLDISMVDSSGQPIISTSDVGLFPRQFGLTPDGAVLILANNGHIGSTPDTDTDGSLMFFAASDFA